jgi:hypothetical protein
LPRATSTTRDLTRPPRKGRLSGLPAHWRGSSKAPPSRGWAPASRSSRGS